MENKAKNKDDHQKRLALSTLAIILLIMITAGVSYAVFTYTKLGSTENTITTGSLKFLYTENTGVGNGINLTNAFPVTDEVGKAYSTEDTVFDFKIEGVNTGDTAIPYEITLREKTGSTLTGDVIKVYLTDMTENKDTELLAPTLYNSLTSTTVDVGDYNEKTIYQDTVAANQANYEKYFRLRMWIDNNTDFSNEAYNNQTFTATVNVYANTAVVSSTINQ